jgi:hypothetical protein
MTREPIYAALFARVLSSTSWAQNGATSGRVLKDVDAVQPGDCPCFFQAIRSEAPTWLGQGTRVKWTVHADLFVYVSATDPTAALPQTSLGNILDAIETALAPNVVTGRQDLGLPDVVAHARIGGPTELYEAVIADVARAVAIVRVEIVTQGT